jgi:hypothetical protein
MCYCNIIANKEFLFSFSNLKSRNLSSAIKSATVGQISALIELLYNSYDVPLTLEGRKLLSKHKTLIKYFVKNNSLTYGTAKKYLLKHANGLQLVTKLIFKTLMEEAVLEACTTD